MRGYPPAPGAPDPVYPPGQFSPWNSASLRNALAAGGPGPGSGADTPEPDYPMLAVSDPAADATATQTWSVVDDDAGQSGTWTSPRAAVPAARPGPGERAATGMPGATATPGATGMAAPGYPPAAAGANGTPGGRAVPGQPRPGGRLAARRDREAAAQAAQAAPPGPAISPPPAGPGTQAGQGTGPMAQPGTGPWPAGQDQAGQDSGAWPAGPGSGSWAAEPATGSWAADQGTGPWAAQAQSGPMAPPRPGGVGGDYGTAQPGTPGWGGDPGWAEDTGAGPGWPGTGEHTATPGPQDGDGPPGPRTGGRSRAGRPARPPRKRGSRARIWLLPVAMVVVVAVLIAVVYLHFAKGRATAAGNTPAGRPTAAGSPSASLGPWKHITTRAEDPKALTLTELYPASYTAGGRTVTRTAEQASPNCARMVLGAALQKALRKGACTQVMRASYLSTGQKIMATIGVLNLATVTGAQHAGQVTGATAFIKQLPGARGPTRKLSQGTGLEEAQIKGHYLILTWAEFTSLKAPANAQQRAQLDTFSRGLVGATANISLTSRMLFGKTQTP